VRVYQKRLLCIRTRRTVLLPLWVNRDRSRIPNGRTASESGRRSGRPRAFVCCPGSAQRASRRNSASTYLRICDKSTDNPSGGPTEFRPDRSLPRLVDRIPANSAGILRPDGLNSHDQPTPAWFISSLPDLSAWVGASVPVAARKALPASRWRYHRAATARPPPDRAGQI
jgi:hypothetical protein